MEKAPPPRPLVAKISKPLPATQREGRLREREGLQSIAVSADSKYSKM
jgi:hypothetical protein